MVGILGLNQNLLHDCLSKLTSIIRWALGRGLGNFTWNWSPVKWASFHGWFILSDRVRLGRPLLQLFHLHGSKIYSLRGQQSKRLIVALKCTFSISIQNNYGYFKLIYLYFILFFYILILFICILISYIHISL